MDKILAPVFSSRIKKCFVRSFGASQLLRSLLLPVHIESIMKGMVMSIEADTVYQPIGIVSEGKRGHSCCGCCCDMRRAVIVVNILLLIGRLLCALGIDLMLKIMISQPSDDPSSIESDDVTIDTIKDHKGEFVALLVIALVGVLCSGLSIYGAIAYNKYLVAANAIFLVLQAPFGGFPTFIANGLYLYPHVFLIFYLHNGVISKENYANERQSCCCV